jgi:hypothetical protein
MRNWKLLGVVTIALIGLVSPLLMGTGQASVRGRSLSSHKATVAPRQLAKGQTVPRITSTTRGGARVAGTIKSGRSSNLQSLDKKKTKMTQAAKATQVDKQRFGTGISQGKCTDGCQNSGGKTSLSGAPNGSPSSNLSRAQRAFLGALKHARDRHINLTPEHRMKIQNLMRRAHELYPNESWEEIAQRVDRKIDKILERTSQPSQSPSSRPQDSETDTSSAGASKPTTPPSELTVFTRLLDNPQSVANVDKIVKSVDRAIDKLPADRRKDFVEFMNEFRDWLNKQRDNATDNKIWKKQYDSSKVDKDTTSQLQRMMERLSDRLQPGNVGGSQPRFKPPQTPTPTPSSSATPAPTPTSDTQLMRDRLPQDCSTPQEARDTGRIWNPTGGADGRGGWEWPTGPGFYSNEKYQK